MATEKQIAANRRNALKSTGPKSARGKYFSRLNNLRHGLRAAAGRLPEYDPEVLRHLRSQFLGSRRRKTPEQARLLGEIALARAKMLYWEALEAGLTRENEDWDTFLSLYDRISQRLARYQRIYLEAHRQYRLTLPAQPKAKAAPVP